LRTKAAADAIKFTIEKKYQDETKEGKTIELTEEEALAMCSIDNGDDCEMCSG
jgi:hypothetical protein